MTWAIKGGGMTWASPVCLSHLLLFQVSENLSHGRWENINEILRTGARHRNTNSHYWGSVCHHLLTSGLASPSPPLHGSLEPLPGCHSFPAIPPDTATPTPRQSSLVPLAHLHVTHSRESSAHPVGAPCSAPSYNCAHLCCSPAP